ncbi:MAG TPA: BatD family protein [Flavobacteriales bacterium]|nr:BatD family protein [Flavobacteriales bacterium]
MPINSYQALIAFLFVGFCTNPLHAQEVAVQAGRLDTARGSVLRRVIESTRFHRDETIELQFKIEADIDSISKLEGKGFTVISGPGVGRTDSWQDGEHVFAEWRYYQIKPRKRGRLTVPSMILFSSGKEYRSEPLELVIER